MGRTRQAVRYDKGRHGLCMMTDAKHRARSARGARGSNPSQKTPRQRSARSALYLRTGEFIPTRSLNRHAPSTRVARSLLFKSARLASRKTTSQRGTGVLFS